MLTRRSVSTPTGTVVAIARDDALAALIFEHHWEPEIARLARRFGEGLVFGDAFPERLARALEAYVEGDVHAIDALPVDVLGTPLQMRVWAALRTIPAGETISYQELARRAGSPGAERAVGNANGKNPVAIVIPCHRVIRADGTLGGYGGGLPCKRWLLAHEQRHAPRPLPLYA